MHFSLVFAAAVWALQHGSRSETGAAAVTVDTGKTPLLLADLRRRLDDSSPTRCSEEIQTSVSCIAGLPDYESCLECTSSYVPDGESGGTSGGCDTASVNLCGPIEACSCAHPCLGEYSAMTTCLVADVDPSCTISCGGGGSGRGGSGGGGGGGSSNGGSAGSGGADNSAGAARRALGIASMAVAVAWGIVTH